MRSQLYFSVLNMYLHLSLKLQHPVIFSVCVASLSADADDFSSSLDQNSFLDKLFCEERKKMLTHVASIYFFFLQKNLPNKELLS
jgi:hypothetical protein